MARRNKQGSTLVKNEGSFHPEEDLKHHKSEPSGAVPPRMDYEDDPRPGLALLDTEELRMRARSLVIEDWQHLGRDDLIASLYDYWKQKNEAFASKESVRPHRPIGAERPIMGKDRAPDGSLPERP